MKQFVSFIMHHSDTVTHVDCPKLLYNIHNNNNYCSVIQAVPYSVEVLPIVRHTEA